MYFVPGISFKVVGNSDIRSAKALQHGEIIRPFSAKLGFELFVGDDALGDQQLRQGIRHGQCAHHQFFEAHSIGFCSSAIVAPLK